MTTETEQVKDTIRKLLNLSESSTFEGEIDNALRFAHRLMSAHHLKTEDVHERAADEEKKEFVDESCQSHGVSLSTWERSLGMFVKEMIGGIGCYQIRSRQVCKNECLVYDQNGKAQRKAYMQFYGLEDEVELAVDLYNRLSHTIVTMARLRYGGALRGIGRSYGDGFVDGLQTQLDKIEQQAIDGSSRELVVQSQQIMARKQNDAIRWLRREQGIRLRSSRSVGGQHNDGAYSRGQVDGRKADGRPSAKRLRIGN